MKGASQYFQTALALANTTFTPALRSKLTQTMKILHGFGWPQEFQNKFLESPQLHGYIQSSEDSQNLSASVLMILASQCGIPQQLCQQDSGQPDLGMKTERLLVNAQCGAISGESVNFNESSENLGDVGLR